MDPANVLVSQPGAGLTGALHLAYYYGLGIFLAVVIAIFLGWLLWYMVRENSKRETRIYEENTKREANYAAIIQTSLTGLTIAWNAHDKATLVIQEKQDEANRRQREEHEIFQKKLDVLASQQERMSGILQGLADAVKNLNNEIRDEIKELNKEITDKLKDEISDLKEQMVK